MWAQRKIGRQADQRGDSLFVLCILDFEIDCCLGSFPSIQVVFDLLWFILIKKQREQMKLIFCWGPNISLCAFSLSSSDGRILSVTVLFRFAIVVAVASWRKIWSLSSVLALCEPVSTLVSSATVLTKMEQKCLLHFHSLSLRKLTQNAHKMHSLELRATPGNDKTRLLYAHKFVK